MSADGIVLVVGSGHRRYREYLLRGAASERPLWLCDSVPATWQQSYLCGGTTVDVTDPEALVAAAERVARRRRIAGVLCYDEALILPAAHVAAALDVPGMRPEAVWNCRDKHRTRSVLAAAGIGQPESVTVRALAGARQEAERIGYPVVLKPRGLGASQGVALAEHAAGLEGAYAAAVSARYPGVPTFEDGVLVEEYLDGPEISVDGVVDRGVYQPLFLARKQLGQAPFFEEEGHVVDPGDPLLACDEILDVLARAHAALGVDAAITHTELRLTKRGPRIVEVNGRLGGDLIPYLGMLATGIDPGALAARVVTGAPAAAAATRAMVTGIRFLYPREDCRVAHVDVSAARVAQGVVEADPMAAPGTVLRLPPRGYVARAAFVIAQAESAPSCRARLESAEALVRVDAVAAPDYDPTLPDASWLPAAARALVEAEAS